MSDEHIDFRLHHQKETAFGRDATEGHEDFRLVNEEEETGNVVESLDQVDFRMSCEHPEDDILWLRDTETDSVYKCKRCGEVMYDPLEDEWEGGEEGEEGKEGDEENGDEKVG